MQTFTVPAIGTQTVTYQDGVTPDPAVANASQLATRAAAALTNNQAFLALASPTNAQVLAQVKALTRQMDGVIRFLLSEFDSLADS